jgi:outer membrane receptor protein involved in Fe transport
MKKNFTSIIILLLMFTLSSFAQEPDTTDIFDMSLEDLISLEVQSGRKKSESISNVPASIVIITEKDIKEQGWQSLEEILTHVPGIYMINDYLWFGSDNFGVRGFFSTGAFGNMTVMVNGVSQKEDWYNSFPLTKVNVPVEAIDRIEIIRGPMSVVYGSNAFLGSVNIITNEDDNESTISLGGGSRSNYKIFAKHTQTSKDFSYSVNAGIYVNSGIDKAYADMMSNPEDPANGLPSWGLSPTARTTEQLSNKRGYLGSSFTFGNFYFENSQSFTRRGVIDFYPGYEDGHLAEIQASNMVFGYKREIQDHSRLNVQLGHYNFRNRLDYKHNSDTTAYSFNDIYSNALDVELSYALSITQNFKTEFGLYYRYIYRDKLIVDAPNLSPDYINLEAGLERNEGKHNRALYTQLIYNPNNRFQFIGGLRAEQSPRYDICYRLRLNPANNNADYLKRKGTYMFDDVILIPRLAVLYNFTQVHHIKLMYGMAVKEPSIGENMDVVRFPDRPQLKPAYMQTYELNYIGMVTDFLSLNGSVFHNRANQLISRTNTIQDGQMQLFNTNSGELQTNGAELSIMLQPDHSFFSKISITYQNSKNLQAGYEHIKPGYAPDLLAYITASYHFYKNHSLGFSAYYIDAMKTYWAPDEITDINDNRSAQQLIADGGRIGDTVPAYFLGNINLRLNNLFDKGLFFNAYIHNIADSEVRYPTTRSNDVFDRGTLGYGRYFSLELGIEF